MTASFLVRSPIRADVSSKLLKLADKVSNLRSVATSPPSHWPDERRREYVAWSTAVAAGPQAEDERVLGVAHGCYPQSRVKRVAYRATVGLTQPAAKSLTFYHERSSINPTQEAFASRVSSRLMICGLSSQVTNARICSPPNERETDFMIVIYRNGVPTVDTGWRVGSSCWAVHLPLSSSSASFSGWQ